MTGTYKTPGVYVEEIPLLPPSVAEVSTAIPAFLGHTQKGANTVARVTSLLEFEEQFGGPAKATIAVTLPVKGPPQVAITPSQYILHHAVNHFFKNGGGVCWIVSIGDHATQLSDTAFSKGLGVLEKEDEPTLVVMPDAVGLSKDDFATVCQAALRHCKTLGDRFAILDVKDTEGDGDIAAFRTGIGTNYLDFGAAYYPYVETTLQHAYVDEEVDVSVGSAAPTKLDTLRSTSTATYQQVKKIILSQRVTLPSSAAVAGVYASVDRDRGMWKAPANVSLSAVIGPTVKITNEIQDGMNVDADNGKSINAIRAFTGKGTLVWGARTLAGNDNEWRYIPVRRLFLMIEESARKATGFAVFEPNDTGTWLKVKGMLQSFLYGLWERGALAGSTPEAAYFVEVGLGKTMTTQDVLEGRMIVKIGVAAVRPAEFIVLQFTHKLQEA